MGWIAHRLKLLKALEERNEARPSILGFTSLEQFQISQQHTVGPTLYTQKMVRNSQVFKESSLMV